MTELMIIRHGQSMANLEGVFAGHTDSALSDLGRVQAQLTAKYITDNFKVDKVYASDLTRAFETGKAVADKVGIEVIGNKNLREVFAGAWEGVGFLDLIENYGEEYKVWITDLGNAKCTDGESVVDLQKRIVAEVKRIAAENEGKRVVIATHATPVRALQTYCMGKTLDEMKDIEWVSNASVTFIKYENGELILEKAGYDEHLGDIKTELPKGVS